MTLMEPMRHARETQAQPMSFQRDLELPPGNTFVRLMVAKALAQWQTKFWQRRVFATEVAERMWPSDRITIRATSAPAMTGVAGWAAELVQKVVADGVEALGAVSAAGEVLKQCLVLNWDGAGVISAPSFVASASNGGFVAEGNPIPVRQLASAPCQLLPYKLASIAVLTREMAESSNAEALISDALIRSAGLAADAALFDNAAASAARPAGLRNGIAATTASNNADMGEAFAEDFSSLINAVAAVGGNGPYCVVSGPGVAASMAVRFINNVGNLTVAASTAVGSDMIMIACPALVAALSPEPEVEAASAATLVMDTTPTAAGTMQERGLFQTDSIAVKVRWPVSWALRDPRGVAWLTPSWK